MKYVHPTNELSEKEKWMPEDRDIANPLDQNQSMDALPHRCQHLTVFDTTIKALATTTEQKEPYRVGHCQWVTAFACSIAVEMSLPGSSPGPVP